MRTPIGIYLTHPRVLLRKRARERRICAYSFKYRYKSEGLIDLILQGVMSVNLLLGSGSIAMKTHFPGWRSQESVRGRLSNQFNPLRRSARVVAGGGVVVMRVVAGGVSDC